VTAAEVLAAGAAAFQGVLTRVAAVSAQMAAGVGWAVDLERARSPEVAAPLDSACSPEAVPPPSG
jgi:hypothetical protein